MIKVFKNGLVILVFIFNYSLYSVVQPETNNSTLDAEVIREIQDLINYSERINRVQINNLPVRPNNMFYRQVELEPIEEDDRD